MGERGPGARGGGKEGARVYKVLSGPKPWKKPGMNRAGRVIAFVETLVISSGKGAGKGFKLRPWQKGIIKKVYRTGKGGLRLVREALLTIGRKNGKTQLVAALCLCHLLGPESEDYGECYSAASDRNQASRIFRELERFITADEDMDGRTNIKRFEKTIEVLSGDGDGSTYQALSSDATKAHSLNPSFIACDEVAQWRGREMFDNLRTGMGAREQPLMITLSTKSQDQHSVMSEVVDYGRKVLSGAFEDETFCGIIYETPIPEDPIEYAAQMTDEKAWQLANPALGDFLSLANMRKEAAQAIRMPSREASFRALYLNQEVDAAGEVIPMVEWHACRGLVDLKKLRGARCYGGLDLGSTKDLTSFALYFPGCGALLTWSWVPMENIDRRSEQDRVPYRRWVDEGHLLSTEGKAVNRRSIALQIAAIDGLYDIQRIGYDRWRIEDLLSIMADEGIELPLVPIGQGYADMGPAFDSFEIVIMHRELCHDGGPVLSWAISNLAISTDPTGARKPDKSRARERIDPAVAAIMAVGLAAREKPEDDTSRPFSGKTGDLVSGRVVPLVLKRGGDRVSAA